MLCVLRHWLSNRELVVVGDRTYATLRLLAACQHMTPPIIFLPRLRLDAVIPAGGADRSDRSERGPDGTRRHL